MQHDDLSIQRSDIPHHPDKGRSEHIQPPRVLNDRHPILSQTLVRPAIFHRHAGHVDVAVDRPLVADVIADPDVVCFWDGEAVH